MERELIVISIGHTHDNDDGNYGDDHVTVACLLKEQLGEYRL